MALAMALDLQPTNRLPNNWTQRHYQKPSWKAWEQGCRREILIWHRRAGKDDTQLHKAACAAHHRIGNFWHALPQYEQCRKAIWEAINPATGMRRIDEAFPRELRKRTDNSGMMIEFLCGSTWRLVGSDDPASLVGAPPIGICFSEWALSNPECWAYLAPILVENGGWASFITTSRGRNHAYDMLQMAKADRFDPVNNPTGWFSEVLTPAETGFPLELVEKQRQEYHGIFGEDAGDALIEQEYWCSFESAILGAYYGKLLAQAEREGRICAVPWDPSLPVHTAWDLGKGANMALWFFQVNFNEIRVIGCLAGAHDEVIVEIVEQLKKFPYTWGDDWVPHDAKVREHNGKTRVETLIALGRKPRLVPDHHIDDGINAARLTIPRCRFDAVGTAPGLRALREYRALWDPDRRCFKDKPDHDWTSHYGDAWRYLSVAWREIRADPPPKPAGRTIHEMTLNEAWEMLKENPRENRI